MVTGHVSFWWNNVRRPKHTDYNGHCIHKIWALSMVLNCFHVFFNAPERSPKLQHEQESATIFLMHFSYVFIDAPKTLPKTEPFPQCGQHCCTQ